MQSASKSFSMIGRRGRPGPALVWLLGLALIIAFNDVNGEPCRDCGYRQAGWKELSAIPGTDLPGQLSPAPLPSEIDLSSQMPPVGYQGDQASCISWAAVYAVKSYYENLHRKWGLDSPFSGGPGHHVFSPAFSQAHLGNDEKGSTFPEALDVLLREGAVPWSEMPYEPGKRSASPDRRLVPIAREFRIEGYRILSSHAPEGIKRQVAAGHPVMVGILLYENLLDLKSGVFTGPEGAFLGGHSVVIVGYDDDRGPDGAFKIMNSWGQNWGDQGFGWISYKAMGRIIRTALIIEESAPANVATNVPDALPAPEQIVASRGESSRHVEVTWSAVDSALAYEVQRAIISGKQELNFHTIGYSTATLFRDSTVEPGRPYAYRILTLDEKGKSASERAPVVQGFASTNPDPSSRIEILGGKMVKKGTQVYAHLNWQSSSPSFEVQRWNDSASRWESLGTSRAQEFKDYRVSPGVRYTYRIRKVDTNIKGVWSRPLVLTAAGGDLPPAMVTGVQVSRGSMQNRIKLQWDAAPGVNQYLVYRFDPARKVWEGPFRTGQPEYQDGDLKAGQWYGYRIVAVNSAGSGPTSPVVYGRTSETLTAERSIKNLPAPDQLAVTSREEGTLSLNWKKVPDAESYDILLARLPGSGYEKVKTVDASSRLLQNENLKLQDPGAYAIRVQARSGPSVSPASEPVVAFLNPQSKRERWFGLDDNPWLLNGSYRAEDWVSGKELKEYRLTLKENGDAIVATLIGSGKRTYHLSAPPGSTVQLSDGMQFTRSGDGRYIQLTEQDPNFFTNGTLLFVAE